MTTLCPSCGENAVDFDQANTQEQRVCQSCGTVVEEGSYSFVAESGSTAMNFDGTTSWKTKGSFGSGANSAPRLPVRGTRRGVIILQRYVHRFSSLLRLSREVADQSRHFLFNTVYPKKRHFTRITSCRKILAATCVYVVARQNNMKVTLREMAELAEVDLFAFGRIFKYIVQAFNIQLGQIEPGDLIPIVLTQFEIEDEKCKALAFDLCELSKDTLILKGMQSAMAVGVVVIAMEAVGISPQKEKLKEVTQQYGFSQLKQLRSTNYIKRCLQKLAEQIPWISKTVSPKMISRLVPDIIKYHQKCSRLKVSDSRPYWYELKEKMKKERQEKIQRAKFRILKQKQEPQTQEKKSAEDNSDRTVKMADPELRLETLTTAKLPAAVYTNDQVDQEIKSSPTDSTVYLPQVSDALSDITSSSSSSIATGDSLSEKLRHQIFGVEGENLDADDKLIEYLLRNGVSEEKLMDGYYESHFYSCSSSNHSGSDAERLELDDEDIPENDIHQYVRTPSEVAQLKRMSQSNK